LVKIILLSLESSNLPSEMNVASGIGTSLLDLVQLLQELNPKMADPLFERGRPGDIHTSVADISRLKENLSFGEMVDLKEGLS